jgi:hypothetical protein
MFFRRKSIDAEIAGLERRRDGLDRQLQELEAKLFADHADTPPARRDALVDDFARLKSEIAAKITATDSLLENLRQQKREQEAAAPAWKPSAGNANCGTITGTLPSR